MMLEYRESYKTQETWSRISTFFFQMLIYLFTSFLASEEWSITSQAIEEEKEALLKNWTALALLNFDQN